jgi:protein-tyrosine phosphatase
MDKSPTCKIPEEDVTEIIPHLWLGNEKSSHCKKFLNKYNIKHIIRVLPNKENTHSKKRVYGNVSYLNIPIVDSDTCFKDLYEFFESTNNYIHRALNNNEPVLVHCKRGHHRSASVIAAYLIKHLNIHHNRAVWYINYIRPCALRRDTCITRGLYNYYAQLVSK